MDPKGKAESESHLISYPKSITQILVTGGAGFIGSHLVESLVAGDGQVIVFDNLSHGKSSNLGSLLRSRKVTLMQKDVRDSKSLELALENVDVVVHLAALKSVTQSVREPQLTYEVNAEGTRNVLRACLKRGVAHLVYASTCAVYGEARYLPIDEEHPLDSRSPYASSKLTGEEYCDGYRTRYGLPVTILRFFNVYGPRQDEGSYGGVTAKFGRLLKQHRRPIIFGDGEQTRDFIHVRDAVQGITLALKRRTKSVGGPNIFNIGSGRAISINDLFHIMAELTDSDAEPAHRRQIETEVRASQANIERASRVLGFKPKVELEIGLRELLGIRT